MISLIFSLALIGSAPLPEPEPEPDLFNIANEAVLKAEVYKLYYETCVKENALYIVENEKLKETISVSDETIPLYVIVPIALLIGGAAGAGIAWVAK